MWRISVSIVPNDTQLAELPLKDIVSLRYFVPFYFSSWTVTTLFRMAILLFNCLVRIWPQKLSTSSVGGAPSFPIIVEMLVLVVDILKMVIDQLSHSFLEPNRERERKWIPSLT